MKRASEHTEAADTSAPETPKGHKVGKAFNTHNRRFKAGDDITREDLAGTPLDFEHLADPKRGFIVGA